MNTVHLILLSLAVLAGLSLLGCSPGPIGTLFGITDPKTNPGTPSPGAVGTDYLNLISGYAAGLPTLLSAEQQYKPGFVNTQLAGTNQTLFGGQGQPGLLSDIGGAIPALSGINTGANTAARAANIGDVGGLGAAAASSVRDINPQNTALIDQLTKTASTGLAAGSELDPATLNSITSKVRGDWASRGLGSSQPAQLDEAVQEAVGGQNLLQAREAAATNAIGVEQSNITAPAFSLLGTQSQAPGQAFNLVGGAGQGAQTAGATVINPASAYDTFNTAYNARAASNIASAQNAASLDAY